MNLTMSLASAAAFALLNSLWEVALLALLAWLSLTLLRGASAARRHTVGMVWLVAMAAAPVVTFAWFWQAPTLLELGTSAEMPVPLGGGEMPSATNALRIAQDGWWLLCVTQLWLLGVVVMVVRQFGGLRALRRVEQQAFAPLPPEWQARVEALRAALGIARRVSVRLAGHVVSPFTARLLRPLIWLPMSLLTQLPREQLEALLAHELAHIRRLDWCWNALQCLIEALLFHHPGMWWLSRRIREEREHACDDLAVSACGDPVVLAEALAALQGRQRSSFAPRSSQPQLALAAEGGSLMKRVSHLLAPAPARPSWRWPAGLLLLLCSGGLLAMQVVPPSSLLVNLRFDASSTGELTPGNYREYTASYLGEKQRRYRISMDATGHVAEVYTEDGQPRPLDAGARDWLKSVALMNAGSEHAANVEANANPGELPTPPEPPALQPPPEPSESAEFKALMASIAGDPRVIALTGQPATMNRSDFHGSVHLWGARDFRLWGVDDPVGGKASFTTIFKGTKGRVSVRWSGKTEAGVWKADAMALAPLSPLSPLSQ